jgi:hypothetical protein
MGFHTGGLATKIDENVKEISKIEGVRVRDSSALSIEKFERNKMPKMKDHRPEPTTFPKYFHLAISICYAFFLALGSVLWFFLLAFMIVRFRQRINIRLISVIVKCLGVVLCFLGIYFGYLSLKSFL